MKNNRLWTFLNSVAAEHVTFSCVSSGVLARKGGCPTTISYKMTPTLHQSQSWVYPAADKIIIKLTAWLKKLYNRLLLQTQYLFWEEPLEQYSLAFPPGSGPSNAGAAGPSSSPGASVGWSSDSWPDLPIPYWSPCCPASHDPLQRENSQFCDIFPQQVHCIL